MVLGLDTRISPSVTIDRLKRHKFVWSDMQYVVDGLFLLAALIISKRPPILFRLCIAFLLIFSFIIPALSQFFFNALPIFTWLLWFYCMQFIPGTHRPPISVRILPALETILYGGNLSSMLSQYTHPVLDVLAWIPYGIIHFGSPFVTAGLIFLFAPPKTLPIYAAAFGYMNLLGVTIQLLFPAAPPWYKLRNGLAPADYSMPGSPGGLARIDKLLGVDLYTSTFTYAPVVFGAFPSLHSGCATIQVLFLCHLFPKLSSIFVSYLLWIWWSTMYLTHHYFIDLIGGALLSCAVYYFYRNSLPQISPDKMFRWQYDAMDDTVLPMFLRRKRKVTGPSSNGGRYVPLEDVEAFEEYELQNKPNGVNRPRVSNVAGDDDDNDVSFELGHPLARSNVPIGGFATASSDDGPDTPGTATSAHRTFSNPVSRHASPVVR
ncbi:hypothetical protein CANCADRAFT_2216 [Tortispora caseinolytica NRRL Y-17796]|uniref:Phosphatidic acid phosphatase type 2/haloperoxidase domain-containing protein n=1 Tax=Tortispora caseinolytica NRRL Y-17796 TaxID=767744 RepID=A0A1E4TFK8_9ASCO|nr:hypothetical protein CANCADRAFT_2216 [Tortispora caseinolytica NRRL Y-17796]